MFVPTDKIDVYNPTNHETAYEVIGNNSLLGLHDNFLKTSSYAEEMSVGLCLLAYFKKIAYLLKVKTDSVLVS